MKKCHMIIAVATALGCTDARPPVAGRYVLRGNEADSVPFVAQRDLLCVHTVVKGAAEFRADSTYSSTFEMTHHCPSMNEGRIVRDALGVKRGAYRMLGDTIQMYNDAQRFTGAGWLTDNGDTLYVRGALHTLQYVRER